MRALTWQGPRNVAVETVPDPRIEEPTDADTAAWQAFEYADVPEGGTVAVFGLGPVGQLTCRVARNAGRRVIGIDGVPERLKLAADWGVETVDLGYGGDGVEEVLYLTGGRGPDGTVDAAGPSRCPASTVARWTRCR